MAQQENSKTGGKKKLSLIDPVYLKFTKGVIRAIGSMDFYEYFMDAVAHADNQIQFSNRRMEKWIDRTWIDAIENSLEALQKIVVTPRNVIHEEELIVNVANAKKSGPDVVVHLAQHASMVEKYDFKTGDVQPSRLMQKYREDSVALYENRLVYTVLENAHHFVKIRHDALFGEMSDEFGAKLKVTTDMDSAIEHVHMDMYLHIRDVDSALDTDGKHGDDFDRVSRLYRILTVYMNSPFAQQMARLPRVKGTIVKTNVLKKNPNYRTIVKLGEFLRDYSDIGYTVNIIEQAPIVTEEFQKDIFHNVLFNYLVLKGYLEREQDRRMPVAAKEKKRALKPKFIKQIIEELTEDYDLPEVEIRKVLIEELTKEQLMQEEAAERRRLVEEQAKRKKEEQERIRQEKAAEKERIRLEKAAQRERIRQEKEAEKERQRQEEMARQIADTQRCDTLKKELQYFAENLEKRLQARETASQKQAAARKEFEDAAKLLEEAEQRKKDAKQREKKRILEEQERIRREKELAEQRRQQELLERQERLRQEQDAKDTQAAAPYVQELAIYTAALPQRMLMREEEARRVRLEREQLEAERRRRLSVRGLFGRS